MNRRLSIMYRDRRFLHFFIFLSSLLIVVAGDCTLSMPNSRETDFLNKLAPLKGLTRSAEFSINGTKKYDYHLGICADAQSGSTGVGVLQVEASGEKKSHVIGRYDQTQIMGGENWMLLTYKGGDPYHTKCLTANNVSQTRQAKVMITCNPDVTLGTLKSMEENIDMSEECYYLFEIDSSAVCAPPKPKGLSGGAVFCIIFFTFAGTYLIIGLLYQRIVVGAKGLEQIPNYAFWKNFGELQADGCNFLCRCGERQDAKMYRGIDERLSSPERRDEPDDHLLPM